MNTKEARAKYVRQSEIRAALRVEYRAGAANEQHVAILRNEMSGLPHTHALNEDKVCGWCWYGTDEYTMPLADILAKTAEYEAASDALVAKVFQPAPKAARTSAIKRATADAKRLNEIAAKDERLALAPAPRKATSSAPMDVLYHHYEVHGGYAQQCTDEACRVAYANRRNA